MSRKFALVKYGDSSSDDEKGPNRRVRKVLAIDSAHMDDVTSTKIDGALITRSGRDIALPNNLTYEEMYRPMEGPTDLFTKPMENVKNTFTGHVQTWIMPTDEFETRRKTFANYGYALDPSKEFVGDANSGDLREVMLGDVDKAVRYGGASVINSLPPEALAEKRARRRKRKAQGDPSNVGGYRGPWAGYESEEEVEFEKIEDPDFMTHAPLDAEEEQLISMQVADEINKRAEAAKTRKSEIKASLVEKQTRRQWFTPPTNVGVDLFQEPGSRECLLPKKHLRTWTGHTKGVNVCKFFPVHGHLLLSASLDTTIKIWDVYHEHKCLKTYENHSKAVRDICFSSDGRKFVSCGFDKLVCLWDTETGQLLQTMEETSNIPACVRFHPTNDEIVLRGNADGIIQQYDFSSRSIVKEYGKGEGHNAPVHSIEFVDEDRFVSSSEDRTVRIWDFALSGKEQQTSLFKLDPATGGVNCIAIHPAEEVASFQGAENEILSFSTEEPYARLEKKRFTGHTTSGYNCSLVFSPDGKYLMSGDSTGQAVIWSWKSGKIVKRMDKAHTQAVVGCDWHPQEASKLATCSWDATIKLWGYDSRRR